MRVAITGSSGFIGTNLTNYFAEHEPDTELVLIDTAPPAVCLPRKAKYVYADVRNLKSLIDTFTGCEEVYHLAGVLGTSELTAVSSLACEVNILGANNVMDAAIMAGVKKVYNVAKPHFDGYSENSYTLTKHAGELIGQLYQEKYGLEVSTVRWLNAVGPHQHLYPVRKFLPMMILLALYNYPLEIYGDGKQTIDPIDVEDLCRFTVYANRNLGKESKVVDLGSGSSITCNDAATEVLKVLNSKGHKTTSSIKHIPMREGEAPGVNLVADMSYWNSVGMKCEVPFSVSIEKTLQYILELEKTPAHYNALKFYGISNA